MLITEAQLGDVVRLHIERSAKFWRLHAEPTADSKSFIGTVIAIDPTYESRLVGWREDEDHPTHAFERRARGTNNSLKYAPNQTEFKYAIRMLSTQKIGGIVSSSRPLIEANAQPVQTVKSSPVNEDWRLFLPTGTCPCGLLRGQCSYH